MLLLGFAAAERSRKVSSEKPTPEIQLKLSRESALGTEIQYLGKWYIILSSDQGESPFCSLVQPSNLVD